MEHLNYCRKILLQFKAMSKIPSIEAEQKSTIDHIIDLCRASSKFLLPENGKLLPDDELRALDESIPLKLPYTLTALEYERKTKDASGNIFSAKMVIFCRQDDDGIYVRTLGWRVSDGFWMATGDSFIPKTGYLDRTDQKNIKCAFEYSAAGMADHSSKQVIIVLHFLNALACSNVYIERSQAKKENKKIKSALPFDSYHILTIDAGRPGESTTLTSGGSHRSPREHLRRGHIVRPGEGRKPFWRNATVVCAGRGFNKVEKDYRIKNSSCAFT